MHVDYDAMADLSANIRLRPIRIGFLVRPNDFTAVRKIMRYCTCVWGGVYNPIIPVFRSPPKEWSPVSFDRIRGLSVARGYINFFEPDVYVEAQKGLLEAAGLGVIRKKLTVYDDVLTLKEFLHPENDRDWSEPAFGLSVRDIHRHLYQTEQQFQQRDQRDSVLIKPEPQSAISEAVFGVYPTQRDAAYIADGYKQVFKPVEMTATPTAWLKVFKDYAITPLRVTRYGLEPERTWHHDTLIYVFDPTRTTDLIDLWNLRLEPHPVVPIPMTWFKSRGDFILEIVRSSHRPIQGNPQGLMHHATIEFGRSINKDRVNDLMNTLKPGLPQDALMVKHWRNPIWIEHRDDRIHRDRRMSVTAVERNSQLVIEDKEELRTSFQTLAPEFAARHGGRGHRWVNAVKLSIYSSGEIATVLPFNLFDTEWPRLGMGGDRVIVSSEGWIFIPHFKNSEQPVQLLASDAAIIGYLERHGIKAKLSEPGNIAKQMLGHLGGLWATHLLADLETLELLNKMAGGVRRRANNSETIEETFEFRTAPAKEWQDLIARRRQRRRLPDVTVGNFTKRNIIRLGLETECPHCQSRNWSSLTAVDYSVSCDRCLKDYSFPQAELREHNRNWFYRVVGPFSLPDYGRGSYASLLTLAVINRFNTPAHDMTYSTAMNLTFDGIDAEVDFLAWRRDDRFHQDEPPEFIFGEAKSSGKGQLIRPRDLAKLKTVAKKLPGSVIVISVLRDSFIPAEKKILRTFVNWARRLNVDGEPTNPVLLLTSHELLFDFHISETWKGLGDPHKKFSILRVHTHASSFCNIPLEQIYLGLPSFVVWQHSRLQKKFSKRARGKPGTN